MALRVRVKSLTTELALLRRGLGSLMVYSIYLQWQFKLFTSDANLCSRATPTSARISSRADGEIYRSLSRERRMGYGTSRARSGSRERIEDRVQRSEERGRRADSSGPRRSIPRPSPSPTGAPCSPYYSIQAACKLLIVLVCSYNTVTGSRVPRFDPTAYIQDRQRRQKEAEIKKFVSTISPSIIECAQNVFF